MILSHIPSVSFRSFKGENSYLSETRIGDLQSEEEKRRVSLWSQRLSGLWMCPDVHGMNKAINLYSSHVF